MRVLACLNGIGSWRAAFEQSEIPLDVYFSSETDKVANAIVSLKYPDVYQLGDIRRLRASDVGKIDILTASLPRRKMTKIVKTYFHHIVRLIEEIKPRYFIIETPNYPPEDIRRITEALFIEHIPIDANHFSCQHRNRLFWFNFPLTHPIPRRFHKDMLQDVLLPDPENRLVRLDCPEVDWKFYKVSQSIHGVRRIGYVTAGIPGLISQHARIFSPSGKSPTLFCSQKSTNRVKIFHKYLNDLCWLTPTEAERIQGFPDDYTLFSRLGPTSDSVRFNLLGLASSVPTLKFLLDNLWLYEQMHT